MTRYEELLEMIAAPTEECIIWPYKPNRYGYGQVYANGKGGQLAHRVALATISEPPTEKHVAAHGPCNDRLCVNPRHSSWKTQKENIADKHRDGTHQEGERHGMCRLTEDQVLEIRSLHATGNYLHRELAAMFDCDRSNIGLILRRKHWNHI